MNIFSKTLDLTDKLSLTCVVLSFPYFFIFNSFGFYLAGNAIPIFIAAFFLPLLFNRLNYKNLARITLLAVATILLFFYSLILGKASGAYLVFFSIVSLPIILIEPHHKKTIIITSLFPIIVAYTLEIIGYKLYFHQAYLNPHAEIIIHACAMSTTFIFSLLSSYFFYTRHKLHEKKLLTTNHNLEQALKDLQQKEKQDAELAIAKDISLKMIQKDWPRKGPVIMDYVYHPATHASGDYLMTKQFSEHEHAILIADVAGHGLPACLMMTSLKSLISTIIYRGRTPGEMINILNGLVYHSEEITKQAPVLFGMINTEKMTFTYANGGHQEGYLFSPTTAKFKKLKSGGLPIGLYHNAKYEEHTLSLHPNDVIIFFTDGLNEGRNARGEPFGIPKIKAKIRKHLTNSHHSTLATTLHRSFTHFNKNQPTRDDITILTAWIRP